MRAPLPFSLCHRVRYGIVRAPLPFSLCHRVRYSIVRAPLPLLTVPSSPLRHCEGPSPLLTVPSGPLQHCEGSTRCPVANQAHQNVGDSLESSWGFEPHLGLLFQHLLMVPVFLLNLLAIQSKTHLPLFHTVSIPGASSSLSSFHGMLDLFLRI